LDMPLEDRPNHIHSVARIHRIQHCCYQLPHPLVASGLMHL
jgi:hypothetical protein